MKIILNIKNYTTFAYSPFLERGQEVEAPEESEFVAGQLVAVKREEGDGKEELAVVLGCIDAEFDGELRLDLCGMTCFEKIRPAVMSDFENTEVVFREKILKEIKEKNPQELYEIACEIYEEEGQSAVFDFANIVGIEEYKNCEPCETESPTADGTTCLVCGSEVS